MLMCAVFVVVASALGLLVGALAGYFGGTVDDLLMRAVDITLALPFLAVVLVLAAAFPSARSPVGVALLIALTSWMALARIVRAQFLVAARAGVRRSRAGARRLRPAHRAAAPGAQLAPAKSRSG